MEQVQTINNFKEQKSEVVNPFSKLLSRIKNFKVYEWMNFIGMFLFLITFVWTIRDFVNYIHLNKPESIFFGIFDRFTNQSNWILFIFAFMYFWWPNHSFFKDNKFLISAMVYIFFTFIGYNVVLVGIAGGYGYDVNKPVDFVSNFWLHILCPIYFIVFGYIFMIQNKNKQPLKFHKLLLTGMIYPTIYAIYLVTIPFVYKLDGSHSYTIYGSATNTAEYPISWAYICVMYFIFFPGSYAIFYYSWIGINKINKKENKSE